MRAALSLVLALLLVAAVVPARAQEAEYEMEEVVITGSKLPQTPGNVTQKIEIIQAAQFDDRIMGNGNLAELLSYSPGNYAAVLSRNDANWGSSGGLAHTYKGYMLDGLPIDAFVDLQSLDPWAFERVEDQRGSASVLYPTYLAMDFAGNQSPMAGTANFILRERIRATVTRAGVSYGSFNTKGTRFYHQRAAGNLNVFFGANYESSDYTDYGTKGSWLNMIQDPAYEKTKLYMRGTYYLPGPAGHRIGLYAHRTWHNGSAGRPNRDFDHQYTTINANYLYPVSGSLLAQVKAGYREYLRLWEEDNFARDAAGIPIPASLALREEDGVDAEIIPVDASLSLAHGDNDLLTVGADYQSSTYKTHAEVGPPLTMNDAEATGWGLYAQEEQRWNDFVFRVGGRFAGVSHDIARFQGAEPGRKTNDWTKALWSGGVRYNPNPTLTLFANAGSSFKAPGLKSVGGTISPADTAKAGASGHLPNPDIKPESGISLDLGGSYLPLQDLTLGLRGFYIAIDDQITQIVVPASGSLSQDINAGKTTTMGLEAEVSHRVSDQVTWFANYTYTTTDIKNPEDADKDGAAMTFVPQNAVNAGVHLTLPQDVRATVTLQLCSSITQNISKSAPGELDGYELVSARVEKLYRTGDGFDLRFYLEPYNITNNTYEMPWGFQDTGFSVNGGMTVGF
ncbi:MAG: TonB-dependent receptor [Gemmatimonadota bacterium]